MHDFVNHRTETIIFGLRTGDDFVDHGTIGELETGSRGIGEEFAGDAARGGGQWPCGGK